MLASGVKTLNQSRDSEQLQGMRNLGNWGNKAPDALRLDEITQSLADMYSRKDDPDADDANFGTTIGSAAANPHPAGENSDWADASRESINAMLSTMSNSGRKTAVMEYEWFESGEIPPRRNKALIFAVVVVGAVSMGIAGYGFYSLGQKEAIVAVPKITIAKKTAGEAVPDEAADKVISAIDKDVSRIAAGENAHIAPGGAAGSGAVPVMADSAAGLKADLQPEQALKEVLSDSGLAERGAAKAVAEPVTAPVVEILAAPDKARAVSGGTPEAPVQGATAPEKVAAGPVKAPDLPDGKIESLDSLTKSVVLAVVALGKQPEAKASGGDPASVLRARMTKLVAAAARQGKALRDVELMLENALAELPAEAAPDVLKDARGKVNVAMLLSAITPAAETGR